MNFTKFEGMLNRQVARRLLLGLLVLPLAGCGDSEVKVYKVAKGDDAAAAAPTAAQAMPGTPPGDITVPTGPAAGNPQLKWTLPDGWTEKPAAQMRLASFSAPGKDGKLVDISIVPLPGMAGGDLSNVNRWRSQVGLPPIEEADLAKQAEPVKVGEASADLYDMTGTDGSSRILAVGFHREDMMWFFKATGDGASVGDQKANFISFLKSLQFAAPDATAALPAGHPNIGSGALPPMGGGAPDQANPHAAAGSLPNWTVPAGWQTEPPTAMLLAKFSAAENSQKAEITISSFPGDVGGLLANVNRWRHQVSLPPLEESGLNAAVAILTTSAGPASQVDFSGTDAKTGQPARLVGVVLPLNGTSWFYKLMGDATVVEHQKAAFLQFVQGVKY